MKSILSTLKSLNAKGSTCWTHLDINVRFLFYSLNAIYSLHMDKISANYRYAFLKDKPTIATIVVTSSSATVCSVVILDFKTRIIWITLIYCFRHGGLGPLAHYSLQVTRINKLNLTKLKWLLVENVSKVLLSPHAASGMVRKYFVFFHVCDIYRRVTGKKKWRDVDSHTCHTDTGIWSNPLRWGKSRCSTAVTVSSACLLFFALPSDYNLGRSQS